MINYDLKYSVAETAKILKVDKQTIKNMAYHFSEYLSEKANPPKGIKRIFNVQDLCTLGYISMYWEDEPDFEHIRYGLNAEEHFESPYDEFAVSVTPIFREFSEEFIGGNGVWMIGGIADIWDKLYLADSYKSAGDLLIDAGAEDETNIGIIYPAIYNYRHATELYLKALIPNHKETHDLQKLYSQIKELLKDKFDVVPPKWFENIIIAFDEFDPGGTTFRYGIEIEIDEMFIDLSHIKKVMNWLKESIHNINKNLI